MTHTCTKVTVCQRAIRNNRISLYLDYYPAIRNPETMQMSRREYLGIYIYAHPKNEMKRELNKKTTSSPTSRRCAEVRIRNGCLSISISITSSKGNVPLVR